MKRLLLFSMTFIATSAMNAQDIPTDVKTLFTMTGTPGEETTISAGVYDESDVYYIDFGDGVVKSDSVGYQNKGVYKDGAAKPGTTHSGITKFEGTVGSTGTVTVYGKSNVWYLEVTGGLMPTSFTQEALASVVQLKLSGANIESLTLPALAKLESFSLSNTPVKSVDLSENPQITSLTIQTTTLTKYENQLASINLSKNTALKSLAIGGQKDYTNKVGDVYGKLETINLTNNVNLESVNLQYNQLTSVTFGENKITDLYLQNNRLETFDATVFPMLKNIYISDNLLTTLDLSKIVNKGTIQIQNNYFSLGTLPAKPAITTTSKYTYVPQNDVLLSDSLFTIVSEDSKVVKKVKYDLTTETNLLGVLTEPQPTTVVWKTAGGNELVEGTDYTKEGNVITFTKEQTDPVHAEFTTPAFPKFTGKNILKSTDIQVNAPMQLAAVMHSTVDGTTERTINIGTFNERYDLVCVDWGDGVLVADTAFVRNTELHKNAFKGVAKGDGFIKVYASDPVWYFGTSVGSKLNSISLEGLSKAHQISIGGTGVGSIDVTPCDSVRVLTLSNNKLTSIDVSKNKYLTSLILKADAVNDNQNKIESIDLSQNTELTDLNMNFNSLKKIDLTANKKVTDVYLSNNELTSVKLDESIKNIYLSNNKLTSLDLSMVKVKGTIQIQNNLFTLATLPTKPAITTASKYTYVPQPAYEVNQTVADLDLSSQLTATGVLSEPATTTYKFVTTGGTELVESTDYETTAPGKFKFLKLQADKVYGVMSTAAFPKFTGKNEYKTTEFSIAELVGINNLDATKQTGKRYNLQGVEVKKAGKGVFIQNGKLKIEK